MDKKEVVILRTSLNLKVSNGHLIVMMALGPGIILAYSSQVNNRTANIAGPFYVCSHVESLLAGTVDLVRSSQDNSKIFEALNRIFDSCNVTEQK